MKNTLKIYMYISLTLIEQCVMTENQAKHTTWR